MPIERFFRGLGIRKQYVIMKKKNYIKAYSVFFVGLLSVAFGVALITKAMLGTSPISAIPYSLSLIIPKLSLGNWTIVFSTLLILIQPFLLGKETNKIEIVLQFVITFIFGYFIDLSMMGLDWFYPEQYIIKFTALVIGCVFVAFGAYLGVIANVVMLPGDAFVRAITKVIPREYGQIRVISDVSMSIAAGILCLALLHNLSGVREGTIVAALITGTIIKFFMTKCKAFTDYLFPEYKAAEPKESFIPETNFVLTVSRQYGSGGGVIAKEIAKELGIAYCDSELIGLAAQKSGYAEQTIENREQKIDRPILHDFYVWYTSAVNEEDMPSIERIFYAEEKVIKELAAKQSCVIVGRLANYILREHSNSLHVFVSADMPARIQTVAERENLSPDKAEKKIRKVDSERANHCKHFTQTQWGQSDNYDITIKSNRHGIKGSVKILMDVIKQNKDNPKTSK